MNTPTRAKHALKRDPRCASPCHALTSQPVHRINPDIWEMVPNDPYGERLFMEAAAKNGNLDDVTAAIISHRSSYVQESDFQLMSKNGINAVRAGSAGVVRALLFCTEAACNTSACSCLRSEKLMSCSENVGDLRYGRASLD